ncbi:MAG: BamA/TamA family outer membrane protein [Bacteroidetes bacterium]|nr:BamA/TamA family outer membrane protein [Bacteroidota bacterium]MBU1718957.1 BamA/TamA family outer membrane protein [Bacteroidota bacterium]
MSLLSIFSACSVKRKLGEEQHLLVGSSIECEDNTVDIEPLYGFIKQKPNRKLLIFRFHAGLYAFAQTIEPTKERKEEKDKKRKAKNKKPKKYKFANWLKRIGEEPAVLDTHLVARSEQQMEKFLRNKGYFYASVSDTIEYPGKKAKVTYKVCPGKPYTYRNIIYKIDDPVIQYLIARDSAISLLQRGDNFDVEKMEEARDRITKKMKNQGFYDFSKEYVYFRADSSLRQNKVDLTIGFKNPSQLSDSVGAKEEKHKQYQINNIFVFSDYTPGKSDTARYDTIPADTYFYLYKTIRRYNPKIIGRAIQFRKNQVYRLSSHEDTYKRLADLKGFKYINIGMKPANKPDSVHSGLNYLDCFIYLTPLPNQYYSFETEGTNSSGNLGIAGSFVYQHRNLFKGFEIFNFKIKGALEFQQTSEETTNNNGEVIKYLPFNTYEYGVESGLKLPRFLIPFIDPANLPRRVEPHTNISAGFNFQLRPEFWRTISNLSFGYEWKYGKFQTHILNPVEFNVVRINKDSAFGEKLRQINDIMIYQSYQDHLTTATQYVFIYNNQDIKKNRNYWYFRFNLEVAGNALHALHKAIGADTTNDGSYRLMQVRYAQYMRSVADLRYYFQQKHSLQVLRLYGGIGSAYGNRVVMPFEKTFFAGGANDIRGWRLQDLGPGSLPDSLNQTLYKRGDMILEANIEHRFDVYKFFKMAIFADAGNIWNLRTDAEKIGAEFNKDRFISELAISAGIGFRFDFSFFIIRLDGAIPMRDPSYPLDERWQLQSMTLKKLNFNLGIGYPF